MDLVTRMEEEVLLNKEPLNIGSIINMCCCWLTALMIHLICWYFTLNLRCNGPAGQAAALGIETGGHDEGQMTRWALAAANYQRCPPLEGLRMKRAKFHKCAGVAWLVAQLLPIIY